MVRLKLPSLPILAAVTLTLGTLFAPACSEAQVEVRGFANGGLLTNGFPAGLQNSTRPLMTGAHPFGNNQSWHFGWRADTNFRPDVNGYWPDPTNHYSFDPTIDLTNAAQFPGRLPTWTGNIRDLFFGDNLGATRYTRNSGPWPSWSQDGGFTGTVRSSTLPTPLELNHVAWASTGTTLLPGLEFVAELNAVFALQPGGSIIRIYASPSPASAQESALVLRVSPSATNPNLTYHFYKFAHSYFNTLPVTINPDIAVLAGEIEVLGGTGVFAPYFAGVSKVGDSYGSAIRRQPLLRYPGLLYNDINFLGDPDPYGNNTGSLGNDANLIKYLTWEVVVPSVPDEGVGARTIGYWKNHSAGRVDADVFPVTFCPGVAVSSDADACSILWANVAKTSNGTKRSDLGQARIKLAMQLLAVIFNEGVFGTNPEVSALITNAKAALCGTNIATINSYHDLADAYNNDPDNHSVAFPNGTGYPSDGNNKAPNGCTSLADGAFFQ